MKSDLIGLLREGLLHLDAGGTAQSYLERPEFAGVPPDKLDELRSLLETAAMLAGLRESPVPAPRAASINRARFLNSAASRRESAVTRRRSLGWSWRPRLMRSLLTLTLILVLLLGAGTGVLHVAAASLPGSALYPVKLAVEDARLLLTPGDLRRAELYLRFANERTAEMLQLCATGQPVDQAVVDRFALQLEGAVSAAASVARSSEPGAAMGILEEVIKSASEQQQTLSQASVVAPETAQPALNASAAAALQTGQVAQQELAMLISVLPTPTQLARLPATASPTRRAAAPTATPVPPTIEPSEPPPPQPGPTATGISVEWPTPNEPLTATLAPTYTAPRDATLTPLAAASGTALPPRPSRTDSPATRTSLPTVFIATPTAAPAEREGTATPAPPTARFRVDLRDGADPVPASFRIHYTACVVNEGEVPLTNASIRVRWTPAQCAYAPPDNPPELLLTVGSVAATAQFCVSFSLNTSVICAGAQVVAEAVATCDQGVASDTETTNLASAPTPTPPVTRTPVVQFSLTVRDRPDPVIAGNMLHLELCVINHGEVALTNVVLEDVWTPRDCVYLPPDNPLKARWVWASVAARSQRCVSLDLNSYSICEGALVTNKATMTSDQGSASAEELTTVVRSPTATPTLAATAIPTEPPAAPTAPATAVETAVLPLRIDTGAD